MRALVATTLVVLSLRSGGAAAAPPNPAIDMDGFVAIAKAAAVDRESRRVDEATFARMMQEPGTVVLDARSREAYDARHVAGAVSLSLPDFTAATLAHAIPDLATRVLIYCNNNFAGDPLAFPLKAPAASLNLSTFVALAAYGYRNVVELGPTADIVATSIPLVPPTRRGPGRARSEAISTGAPALSTPR
ncbi:MAG: rhodanese-like domain-containing protein [Betaproteobacteria bacterium]